MQGIQEIQEMNDIQLAERFAPTFIFHPNETAYPISISNLCKVSVIKSLPDNDIIAEHFTPQELYTKYNNSQYYLDIKSSGYAGGIDQSVELYCIVDRRPEYTDLQYFVLYSYNPGYIGLTCLGVSCCICGVHQGDGEHVTVRLNVEMNPVSVLFSAHGSFEHSWIEWKEVDKIGLSPISYVALGSHANYVKPDRYNRIGCFASDLTSKNGQMWQPNNIVLVDDNTDWNNFEGGLSSHFTNPPKRNSWYKNELPLTHTNPSAFERFFLCCFKR